MQSHQDPFTLLSPQLSEVRLSVLSLLESGHPALSEVAKYYFQHPSKQIRPLVVFLFSRATNGLGQQWDKKLWEATCAGGGKEELDKPLSPPEVLNDWNPLMPEVTTNFTLEFAFRPSEPHRYPVPDFRPTVVTIVSKPTLYSPTYILPTQMRLAEIVEMIHTASLLHDDVIDLSPLRRGFPSAPASFGNKLAVLGGNFVLGRATAALSRLGTCEGPGLLSYAVTNLVEGELLQMKIGTGDEAMGQDQLSKKDVWSVYLQKTYMKTSSLIAKCARAAAVLGGCQEDDIWQEIAYAYGRNLGMAFQVCYTLHFIQYPCSTYLGVSNELQLVDDILDYESASTALGKPSGADLRLGLATCPALYAWEEHPEMGMLIQRKFEKQGDVELVRMWSVSKVLQLN
jgi:hexaprenyl-diphosphate synthase